MENPTEKMLYDHEERIRFLERTGTETQMKLLSIEKSQSDLKVTVMEGNKQTNDNLTKLLSKFVDNEIAGDKNKWSLVFKIWAVIGPILAALAAYLMN
jgi:ribosomal protein S17E